MERYRFYSQITKYKLERDGDYPKSDILLYDVIASLYCMMLIYYYTTSLYNYCNILLYDHIMLPYCYIIIVII